MEKGLRALEPPEGVTNEAKKISKQDARKAEKKET